MSAGNEKPVLFGRSSSHFTRVVRIFASELGIEYSFEIVRDLSSLNIDDYGGNPALKLPSLRTASGSWFGALAICRELSRLSRRKLVVVWPEDLAHPVLSNCQELVLQAMATQVSLILSKQSAETPHTTKMMTSLLDSLRWLESHADEALAKLPEGRALSTLEVTLFCLVTHLDFRGVAPTSPYPTLKRFCHHFGQRESAKQTEYRFDT